MTDSAAGPPGAPPPAEDVPHPESRGTMTLMLLFLAALVLMWGYIFMLMLQGA